MSEPLNLTATGAPDGVDPAAAGEVATDRPLAVSISGLAKQYGDKAAVDGINLSMPCGSLLALLGPNGAGKTTTVEACTGFVRPERGQIRLLGLDPTRSRAALRRRIGVMPQGGGAYPGVHAEEMLRLIAACAATPLEPAWLLDVLGLGSVRRTPFKRLSGGQQQRLSLACALVGRPDLVFLDEPTSGMDPQARHLVWDLLTALRSDGVSVLLTTHLMEEAETLADNVVIIDHGKVLAQGSPEQLTAERGHATNLRFRASKGLDVELLAAALPEGYVVRETAAGAYRVEGTVDPQVISTVTAWCARHGVLAEELHVGRRDLEEVFLELTGRELRP